MNESGSDRVKFGPYEVDLHTHELWKYGTRIKLVGQPFEVLTILLKKAGELVTREELRARLWPGDTFVDFNHGLNAAVNKLREALSDSAESPRYVETLPRRGYRFIAQVERQDAIPAIPPPGDPVSQSVAIPVELPPSVEPYQIQNTEGEAPRVRRLRPYLMGGAFLLVLIFGGTFLLKEVSSSGISGQIPTQRIRPLTSLADETSEPAFSPGGNFLAFRREGARPGDSGIFVKAIDGDQLVQLTRNVGDCCPVWSPDGGSIAFSRFFNKEFSIYVVPSTRGQQHQFDANGRLLTVTMGSTERKLDTNGVTPRRGELDWSPDGKTIAFSGGASIFLLSLADSTVHRLTEPPPLSEDWGPAFSADGQKVLFVRSRGSGFPEEIMVTSSTGGEVTRITAEHARILGPPQWSLDGQSVVFASDQGSHPGLWRISATMRESPVQINDSGWRPAVSHRGYRLAYQRITRNLNIWQMDLSASGEKRAHVLVPSTSETDQGPGPQFSPDGMKLAYMSDRSGTMELWVSARDGSNPYQLTAIGGAGTPRWSPDGGAIVFDARGRNAPVIYTVKLQGGAPRLLTSDDSQSVCPSWSRDGKWIYFASDRTGNFQVWKIPAEGGAPVQVTIHGGHAAMESPDGRYVYYSKTQYSNPEIWQAPVGGGAETLVSPLLHPFTWASWSVVEQGILFAGPSGKGKPVLSLFDFATHRVTNLGVLDVVPFWLGSTPDGKTAVFDQPGWQQAQIMLVDNFR